MGPADGALLSRIGRRGRRARTRRLHFGAESDVALERTAFWGRNPVKEHAALRPDPRLAPPLEEEEAEHQLGAVC